MSILTVRQLTALIKDTVENGFPYVWVRGEVTNVPRLGARLFLAEGRRRPLAGDLVPYRSKGAGSL